MLHNKNLWQKEILAPTCLAACVRPPWAYGCTVQLQPPTPDKTMVPPLKPHVDVPWLSPALSSACPVLVQSRSQSHAISYSTEEAISDERPG